MAEKSEIPWCDSTWQVVAGCSVASPGCSRCYSARLLATRLRHLPWAKGLAEMTPSGPRWTGKVLCREDQLTKVPRGPVVFVGDRGDLFHPNVPDEFIARVWARMAEYRDRTFVVLTKRAERMYEVLTRIETNRVTAFGPHAGTRLPDYPWLKGRVWQLAWHQGNGGQPPTDVYLKGWDSMWPLPNVWLGVTAEDQQRADERIPLLLATPAAHRWVSVEPMLGPVSLADIATANGEIVKPLAGLTWGRRPSTGAFTCTSKHAKLDQVIVGGESGPRARPMNVVWARSLRDQCADAQVPFYFKQLGAVPVGFNGADSIGKRVRMWHSPDPKSLEQRLALALSNRSGADPSEWPADLRVRELAWRVT